MARFAFIGLFASLPLLAAGFRASAVKVDITPQTPQWLMGYAARESTGVHDKIYHRVIAMDSGETQFYLISSDLCLFSPVVYDEVAAELRKDLGIESRQIWWSVTHTHAAPEVGPPSMYKALLGRSDHDWDREYTARIKSSLIEAVKKARSTLEPARIAFGQGIALANINRRAKDPEGNVSLGLNPDGPADRQIGLIRLERPGGALIALIVNYAMHGTVLSGKNTLIGGDAPGTVSAYLEQKVGAPVLYVNGAAGDMAPIYSGYDDERRGHLSQFNVLLGDRVLAAAASLGPSTADVSISLDEKFVETPRKDGLPWPDDLAVYSRVENGRRWCACRCDSYASTIR
jgi:neutral ceramidase